MKQFGSSFKISKTAMLIPLVALSMHSCTDEHETGIVKDKIDTEVFLTPVNDTSFVYRVINFDRITVDKKTKNIYLNINKGDTVLFSNCCKAIELKASVYNRPIYYVGGYTQYAVKSVNGVYIDDLPDLVHKCEQDDKIKELNKKYNLLRQHKKQR